MSHRAEKSRFLCAVNTKKAARRYSVSLGTLGGGNHFIEVDRDDDGFLYLVIHSGSRALGGQTAQYYSRLGWQSMNRVPGEVRWELIDRLKAEGRTQEIQQALQELDAGSVVSDVPQKFAYVEGQNLEDYLHDMLSFLKRRSKLQRIEKAIEIFKSSRQN